MENVVNNFWENKKVLVTGHTGFKGSWLSLWLQQLNAKVIGLALDPNTSPNLFTAANVAENMIDVRGDIRDAQTLFSVIQKHEPEIIIHMAAQPLVRYSYSNPVETYMTNVMGTVHLLEAVRQHACVRAVVNVTTDKCYENKEWHWGYREDEPMGGHDPYSNSKGCAELVTTAYRKSYFKKLGLASARAGNVIGGGDWSEDRLLPDIINSCISKKTLQIRYPNATRPWQHVLEPLSGYLHLAQLLYSSPEKYSEAWNFGPDDSDAKPVEWIVKETFKCWGGNPTMEIIPSPDLHEATFLKLDCSKAQARLGWKPRWNIQQALASTVEWYKAFHAEKNMKEETLKQIKNFIEG